MAGTRMDFLLGAVVHNEAPRLAEWLAHWQAMTDNIAIIDQKSTDETAAVIAAAGITQTFQTPVACYCEPDRNHLFKFLQRADQPALIMDGDEYMTPEQVRQALDEVGSKLAVLSWFIRRRNYIDGVDVTAAFVSPQDPQGYDWQLRLCRGYGLHWAAPHRYPDCRGVIGYLDPETIWIEHRRTYDMVKARNGYRPGMPPQMLQMQAQFMERIDALLKKGGA